MVKRILVSGSINVDQIFIVPRIPESHDKIYASSAVTALGGSAANTATWLASDSTFRVEMFGKVGSDYQGKFAISRLHEANVDARMVSMTDGFPTPCAVCISDGNNKTIVTHRVNWEPIIATNPPIEPDGNYDHVHISSRLFAELDSKLEALSQTSSTLSVETNGKQMGRVLKFADIVFMNSKELWESYSVSASDISPTTVGIIAPKPKSLLVITDEDRSVFAASRSGIVRVPVSPVSDIVDRTGAGDSFNAGFLSGWIDGLSEEQSLAKGLEYATKALMKLGGSK